MNEKNVKIYSYVCPQCLNVPENCTCSQLPEMLIQIDKKMLPIIREFNRRWYRTIRCCEGHIGSSESIYIQFVKKYKFKKAFPKGFSYGEGTILGNIAGKSESAKKRNKRKMLKALYEWITDIECTEPHIFIK